MQLKRTKLILIFLIFFQTAGVFAQQWLGRTISNYSGTYGVYNNASSIADSKYLFYFNFWGRGVNIYNNYLTYNAPVKLNHWSNNSILLNDYRDANGKVMIGDDWFQENLNGKNKYGSYTQDIWGPSLMFPVSKKWNLAINTRQRTGVQYFGISEGAAAMVMNGISNNQSVSMKKFSANIQSYQELSFTLGGIMASNNRHKLNGGATFKMIRGLGASYFRGDELNISGTGNTSANVNGSFSYAYTDDKAAIAPIQDPYGIFSLRSRGAGAGLDLGLTYTYRSEKLKYPSNWTCDQNDLKSDYDFRLSVGFNDLGGILFSRKSSQYQFNSGNNVAISPGTNILDGFDVANQNGFDSIGKNVFAAMGATRKNGFSTSLPAAFNLQADIRFTKQFYTAFYWNQSLKGMNTSGLRATSMMSLVPRFESRGFEFSMPLTLSENFKNFYVGAYTRIGPFFFGSDNLGGLLNLSANSGFTGADIYGGISFGIGHCLSKWYKDNVDPVYMDSTENDTLRQSFLDTMIIIERDTIILKDTLQKNIHDTVYIIKTDRPTESGKEIDLKKREEELKKRQAILDAREKELNEREKTPVNETVAIKACNDKNVQLEAANKELQNKVYNQASVIRNLEDEINLLKVQIKNCETNSIKCSEDKVKNNAEILRLQDELIKANKKIAELEIEVSILKKSNVSRPEESLGNGPDAVKLSRATKQIDSLRIVIITLQTEMEKCKKNEVVNNATVTKANSDKAKAENDAKVARKQADSLQNILNLKLVELENCKKNQIKNTADVVKKAEIDKAKAESDARVARKQADSLQNILNVKLVELEYCKKSMAINTAEVMKKAEADKAKAENDAKVARKQADSMQNILKLKIVELEDCRKNSGSGNAELLKKAETDKAKAESYAKVTKKQADSLLLVLQAKNTELENCKKNSSSSGSDAEKLKNCQDENTLLKTEMKSMASTIGKLNTRIYALTKTTDSMMTELKNCGKNGGSDNSNDEALKKCQQDKVALQAEVGRLSNALNNKDKSLDSMYGVASGQVKKQAELTAQVNKLNNDIDELKSKGGDCEALKKELEARNAELDKLKADNAALQTQIKNLNSQLNEYKTEYAFLQKQSLKCSMKLDSCMRGLYNEPKNPGEGEGKGGPSEGNNDTSGNSSSGHSQIDIPSNPETPVNGTRVEAGVNLLTILLNTVLNGSTGNSGGTNKSGSGSGSKKSGRPTEKGSGGSSGSGNNGGTSGSGGGNNSKPSGSDSGSGNNSSSGGKTGGTSGSNGSSGSGTNNGGTSGSGGGNNSKPSGSDSGSGNNSSSGGKTGGTSGSNGSSGSGSNNQGKDGGNNGGSGSNTGGTTNGSNPGR